MHKISEIAMVLGIALLTVLPPADSAFAGQAPNEKICRDSEALKQADVATQGGCIATHRRKGNCNACHLIAGIASGDIAPPLVSVSQRFLNRAQLRAQIEEPRRNNPATVMPPFGTHGILTPTEIDEVVEFLLTL